jgi:hypothetical protein
MDTLVTFIKQRKYSSGSWQEKIPAFLHPFTFIFYVYMQVTNDNFVVNLVISRAELDSFHTGRKFRLPTGN